MRYLVAVIEYDIGLIDKLEAEFGHGLVDAEVVDTADEDARLLIDEIGSVEVF